MTTHPFLRSTNVPAICPKCKSPALHRSHSARSKSQFRKYFTDKKCYRCHVCNWSGWLDENRLVHPSVSLVGSIPTVNGEEVDIPMIRLQDDVSVSGLLVPKNDLVQQTESQSALLQTENALMHPISESIGDVFTAGDDIQPLEDLDKFVGEQESNSTTQVFQEVAGGPVATTVPDNFHRRSRNRSVPCLICGKYNLHRSRSQGVLEYLRKKFTVKRPYRCHSCGWRGWVKPGL